MKKIFAVFICSVTLFADDVDLSNPLQNWTDIYEEALPTSLNDCKLGREVVLTAMNDETEQLAEFIQEADAKLEEMIEKDIVCQVFGKDLSFIPVYLQFLEENKENLTNAVYERNKWLKRICVLETEEVYVCQKIQSIFSCSVEEKFRRCKYISTLYLSVKDENLIKLHRTHLLRSVYLFFKFLAKQYSYADVLTMETRLEWELLNEMKAHCSDATLAADISNAIEIFPKVRASDIDEIDLLLLGTEQISPTTEIEEDVSDIVYSYIFDLFEVGLSSSLLFDPTQNLQNIFNVEIPWD